MTASPTPKQPDSQQPALTRRPASGTGTEASPLFRALASELRQIGSVVAGIAAEMCADEDIVLRHVDTLQQFDLVIQSAEETARVLDQMGNGFSEAEAIGRVRLEAIQSRLLSACSEGE